MSAIDIDAPAAMNRRDLYVAAAVVVVLFCLAAIGSAYRKPITEGFDELVHVSYVAYLQQSGAFWPRLEQLRTIDPVSFQFTGVPSYLNHPPLYYHFVAALGPDVTARSSSLFALRLLNVAIAALGLIALLALGRRMQLSRFEFYAFAIILAASPVLAPLAGSVNNDNAGFADGAITITGAFAYLTTFKRSWLIVACCGMLVASAAKLTGLMLTGGFLAALLALMIVGRQANKADAAIVVGSLVVAALPYFVFTLEYGSPAPNTPGQMQMLREGAQTTGWSDAPRMDVASYSMFFLKSFVTEWMPTLRERNAFQIGLLILPVATLALAAAGSVASLLAIAARRNRPADLVVAAGTLSIIATFALHIVFSYQRHLQTGWMLDAYPRYYLPMVAIVPMAALCLLSRVGSQRTRMVLLSVLIVSPLIFVLFGAPIG